LAEFQRLILIIVPLVVEFSLLVLLLSVELAVEFSLLVELLLSLLLLDELFSMEELVVILLPLPVPILLLLILRVLLLLIVVLLLLAAGAAGWLGKLKLQVGQRRLISYSIPFMIQLTMSFKSAGTLLLMDCSIE